MSNYLKILFLSITLMFPSVSIAFDNIDTHPKITKIAIEKSNLNNYLSNLFNIKDYKSEIQGNGGDNKKVYEWITQGSDMEDRPACRAANHFHNPLLDWDLAKLTNNIELLDWLYCDRKYPEFSTKYSNLI